LATLNIPNFKNANKFDIVMYFLIRTEFLVDLKEQLDVGEAYCWAITRAVGLSNCDRSGSNVGVLDVSWTSMYAYMYAVEQG
jgi:hypothetical protein